jgi:hypothetical protein
MRDKIMTDQLDILEGNRISPQVSYEGLRKVDNLPKDIKKTNEDLFLPPLFNDKHRKFEPSRPGVQISLDAAPGKRLGPFSGQKAINRQSYDSLVPINARHSGHYLSQFEELRNRHYNKNAMSQNSARKNSATTLKSNPALEYRRQPYVPGADYNRLPHPSSAYVPMRAGGNARINSGISRVGSVGQKMHYDKYSTNSNSKYVQHYEDKRWEQERAEEAEKTLPHYSALTAEDYTLEALQQRKLALERLNEKYKNL